MKNEESLMEHKNRGDNINYLHILFDETKRTWPFVYIF